LGIVWGSVSATRISNPHRFFTFQNFEGIIEYAKNESDYTKRIVGGIVWGSGWGIVWGSVEGIVWGSELGSGLGSVSATRTSNPHEVFTFQNFEGIILYATNEPD
jgi:hypothetical protein